MASIGTAYSDPKALRMSLEQLDKNPPRAVVVEVTTIVVASPTPENTE